MALLEEFRAVARTYEEAKLALTRLEQRIDDELIPLAKLRVVKELPDKRITRDTVVDLAKADPEVQNAVKQYNLTALSVNELRIKKEDAYLRLEGIDKTISMLESIGRGEGLRAKIKYGMTKVVVEEHIDGGN